MKRSWLITILLCLLLLMCGGAVIGLLQVVPSSQCSNVYRKYAEVDGIDATFIKDYRICSPYSDPFCLDVTVLRAETDSCWNILFNDFNIGSRTDGALHTDSNTFDFWYAPPDRYDQPMDSTLEDNDFIAVSRHKKTITIFHTDHHDHGFALTAFTITTNKNNNQHNI